MPKAAKLISFEEARKLAEADARENLKVFMTDPATPPLRHEYLEAEHCWMFFRNLNIKLPDPGSVDGMIPDCAYCFSKSGEGREVADLSDDPVKCREYLQKMSDYFKEKGL